MLDKMRKEGTEPSKYTFVALLQACNSLRDLESARRIHGEVVRKGYETDLYVATNLVDAYAKCASLVDARSAFENMPHHDVVAWNAMIIGCAHMGESEAALELYERMQQRGVAPDDRTYVSVLRACHFVGNSEQKNDKNCATRKGLKIARAVHANIRTGKLDMFVATMLVDVYAKCGSLEDARHVFEKMPRRDVVSWNAMILGYALMDQGEVALHLYSQMQDEGVTPDEDLSGCSHCLHLCGSTG